MTNSLVISAKSNLRRVEELLPCTLDSLSMNASKDSSDEEQRSIPVDEMASTTRALRHNSLHPLQTFESVAKCSFEMQSL